MDNILTLLTPRNLVCYLDHDMTLRQAIEKMRVHRYTVIPVLDSKTGVYIGSIAEGDLLYNVIGEESVCIKDLEEKYVTDVIRPNYIPAMKIDTTMRELENLIVVQNYVPIVDDRDILMGIVTRKSVMQYLIKKIDEKEGK